MTTKTIGALLAVVACGATLTIASCESRNTAPESILQAPNGGSKSPDVLTTCASVFPNVEHCTIGTTHLVANSAARTVVITDFATTGNTGVSVSFPDAIGWSERGIPDFGTRTNGTLNFAAVADGEILSELRTVRVDANTANFTPIFTAGDGASSPFHVHVFKNGVLQGGQEGINPNTTIPIVAIYGSGDDDRDGGDKPRRKFHTVRSQQRGSGPDWQLSGACEWTQTSNKAGATFTVRLPNGTTVTGDEVFFTEKVAEGQSVYNNFQRIDITGNLNSYTMLDESFDPAE